MAASPPTSYTGRPSELSPTEQWTILIVYNSLGVISALYIGITTYLFYRLGLNIREIQLRSRGLILLQSLSVLGWSLLASSFSGLYFIGYPCFIHWWGLNFCALLTSYAVAARALRYIYLVNFNHAKATTNYKAVATEPTRFPGAQDPSATSAALAIPETHTTPSPHRGFQVSVLNSPGDGRRVSAPAIQTRGFLGPFINRHHRFFRTDRGLIRVLLILGLVHFLYVFFVQIFSHNFTLIPLALDCNFTWEYSVTFVWIGLHTLVAFPILIYHLWGLSDPYGICRDLIFYSVWVSGSSVMFFLWELVPSRVGALFGRVMWIFLVVNVVHTSSVTMPVVKALREQRRRRYGLAGEWEKAPVGVGGDRNEAGQGEMMPHPESTFEPAFLRMLNSNEGLDTLRAWASDCFCIELVYFLEEYQELKLFLEGTFALPHSGKGELPRSSVFNESSPSFVAPKEGLNSLSLSSMTASHSFQSASAGLAFSNDSFSIHRSTTFYSLAEGMPIEQQYHLSRLSSSIRETWDLLDDSKTTDLIRTQYPVSAKAALKLAYLMFYQRFLDSMSDLRVHVSDRLLAGIGQEIMAGHFPITVFDDVYQDVLMLLYVDVYLKLRNAA
ncbi:hypothetical protein H4R33_001454 [Dimargaris cristalligena]|uniref:RGS domain-containing protein n=1 Tax=Dimargaris cristalligena TaxID=215637 RepID=A0A4Q0A464_9FUNG|nr:hypothetical protein H4R33_001454 [Dimargaris cristalligena]RKP40050.1 hypothetical protein BJ085DRAFT_30552 [Dimargaris cristalligena]|eukprot:RKP40050.1 hypothetical protein BJ085DRAFT_30552 [Dimargaris cristalligena]